MEKVRQSPRRNVNLIYIGAAVLSIFDAGDAKSSQVNSIRNKNTLIRFDN